MKNYDLVSLLNEMFHVELKDVFSNIMPAADMNYNKYCTDTFLEYYQGIMIQGSENINKVAVACFLSDYVVKKCAENQVDFLIVKHPLDWVEFPGKFVALLEESYEICLKNGINVYVIHSALDRHPVFSPSLILTEELNLNVRNKLYVEDDIFGFMCEDFIDFNELCSRVKKKLGINEVQMLHMSNECKKITVVSGGGDDESYLMDAFEQGCDTYITGIVYCEGNEFSCIHNKKFRETAKKLKINLIGGSHYATERFGLIKIMNNLLNNNINTIFIEEEPKFLEIKEKWGIY